MDNCAKFELPVDAVEKLHKVFDEIDHALTQRNWALARDLCKAGRSQLSAGAVCLD
jgi:hypothetical protein